MAGIEVGFLLPKEWIDLKQFLCPFLDDFPLLAFLEGWKSQFRIKSGRFFRCGIFLGGFLLAFLKKLVDTFLVLGKEGEDKGEDVCQIQGVLRFRKPLVETLRAGKEDRFEVHAKADDIQSGMEKEVLEEDMAYIKDYTGKNYDFTNLKFHDEFLLGGYGKTSEEELEVIREVVSKDGMLVDPTYSGKAFYGMTKLIPKGTQKNILFWNTGGIMNLLSQKQEK